MSWIGLRRGARVIGLALVFGVVTSVLKGNGGGVRDAVGNISAPWLIVPLLAGWYAGSGRIGPGAVAGLTATMAALFGFYAANAFVLDLGSSSTLRDVALSLHPGAVLAPFGALTGLVFGAVGAWSAARASSAPGWIMAAVLVFEPLVLVVYFHARGIALSGSFGNPWVWAGEIAVGLTVATVTWQRRSDLS